MTQKVSIDIAACLFGTGSRTRICHTSNSSYSHMKCIKVESCSAHEENWQDWPKGEAANPAGSLNLERGNQTEKISLRGRRDKDLRACPAITYNKTARDRNVSFPSVHI